MKAPIEELMELLKLYGVPEGIHINLLGKLLEKDKAHREKYKHTKEDVCKAFIKGFIDGEDYLKTGSTLIDEALQYYKKQHEQK